VLEIPKRATALDRWNDGEKLYAGGGEGVTLERPGIPWVAARGSSLEIRPQQVGTKTTIASAWKRRNRHD